jgi:hypothetical protein
MCGLTTARSLLFVTRPKNRAERRRRNAAAKDLEDRKYHQRIVPPEQYKRLNKKDLEKYLEDQDDT